MNTRVVRFVLVTLAVLSQLLLIHCKKDKDTNQLPTLTFTAPASLTAERGDDLTIAVNAADPDGQVSCNCGITPFP